MVRLCLFSTCVEYVGSFRWRRLCLNLSACQFLCLNNTTAYQDRVTDGSSIGERSGSIATLSGAAPGRPSKGVDKTCKNTTWSLIARPENGHPSRSVCSCNQQHRPRTFSISLKHVLKHRSDSFNGIFNGSRTRLRRPDREYANKAEQQSSG